MWMHSEYLRCACAALRSERRGEGTFRGRDELRRNLYHGNWAEGVELVSRQTLQLMKLQRPKRLLVTISDGLQPNSDGLHLVASSY